HLRKALKDRDDLLLHPLLASICQALGRTDEARSVLQKTEQRYAQLIANVKKEGLNRSKDFWGRQFEHVLFLIALREARTAITGRDPGPDPSIELVHSHGKDRLARLEQAEDDFARMVLNSPDQPRLWIARGWRLGSLGRWDEAAKAFARATALKPRD